MKWNNIFKQLATTLLKVGKIICKPSYLSLMAAIVSCYSAYIANSISKRANRIAESQLMVEKLSKQPVFHISNWLYFEPRDRNELPNIAMERESHYKNNKLLGYSKYHVTDKFSIVNVGNVFKELVDVDVKTFIVSRAIQYQTTADTLFIPLKNYFSKYQKTGLLTDTICYYSDTTSLSYTKRYFNSTVKIPSSSNYRRLLSDYIHLTKIEYKDIYGETRDAFFYNSSVIDSDTYNYIIKKSKAIFKDKRYAVNEMPDPRDLWSIFYSKEKNKDYESVKLVKLKL